MKMKKKLKLFLTVVFLAAACLFVIEDAPQAQAATRNGWITRGGKPTIMKMDNLIRVG